MHLFVGLGNPGTKYANHRHNVGFMLLDALATDNHAPRWSKKHQGELTEISVDGEKILLLKPQTYMNNSGRSVQAAMAFYKLKPEQITVFHDELDLANAKLRIKTGGGHGGHNGLRDIDAQIGKEYRRIRIGIDHPGHKDAVSGYVLHDFSKDERHAIDTLIDNIIRHTPLLINGEDVALMNKLAL
ncbi:MAG: aminoacyl-tRNA hydrolase [Rickettsiales bacterium]|nr:aminoacyl-tRNA hydrolase [Rickettsiales bacterium]